MSFICQIFQKRLTFYNNVLAKICDVRLIIILGVISAMLPISKCAKLENPQIRLLVNDEDLLQEKSNLREAASAADPIQNDHSGEHFNLYRSELKRLSYETIHRILRDENEPSYRREDTELRYYQKRSPSLEENHQLIKRSVKEKPIELNLSQLNFTKFLITPQILKRLHLVSVLNLAHNYLSDLNLSQLSNTTSLATLNLQNNSFASIPLETETTLRTLNLNNNLIRTSSLNSNIYLRNLFLSGNLIDNLSSIHLSLLKNLETLDISHNLLKNSESSFFTERMHNLKHLNLASNQMGSIYRETFYNLLSLNTLLLSHNNITDIDYETFLALPNLQFLDLSFNNLHGKSIRALQGITGLVALNIAFNSDIGPYMQEFVASWSLKELDASGTGLCQIPAALAQSVRSLKLTHNWLKIINCGDLDSYPLLQYLDLSFSHVEDIEDDALGRLEILEVLMLDNNKLRKIPVSLPVSLEHLFLQNNDIMEIPQQAFAGLSNLKTLDLSHNKLLYLPDIVLPKLQTLNLQSAEIRGISQGIIYSLAKLNDLMLEDNPIKCADLLGIAEWASTCRLRGEKYGDLEQTAEEAEDENVVFRIQNLKNKFERMHNFYEQFGLNKTFVNDTTANYLKVPACVQNNLNTLSQMPKNAKIEKEESKPLSKSLKETNLNAATSSPFLSATNKDANKRKTVREQRKKLQYKNVVEAISIENPTQTLPATMQPSMLNGKQATSSTTTKSFNSNATATTTSRATVLSEKQGQKETEIIVQPRKANEMKTSNHLAAIADADVTTTANQQHEVASIENTPTKSSSSMTELVEAVSKRTKEAQKQLEDMQQPTTFTNTFQTTKSKKWLKREPPVKAGGRPLTQNMEILLKHIPSENINAVQFIESTTFVMPINSETQVTTTVIPPPTTTFATTAASSATTTMAEAFIKENKYDDNVKGAREEFKEKVVHVVGFERTTSKLQMNLEKQKQYQHEIKTKNATAKMPKSMPTAGTATPGEVKPTTAIPRMSKMAFKILPKLTANLNKPNKEINGLRPANTDEKLTTTNSPTLLAVTTTTHKPIIKSKHEQTATTKNAAAKLITLKTFEQQTPTAVAAHSTPLPKTTTTPNTIVVKDKDLASNYNDNGNIRQTTKTLNNPSPTTLSTIPATTATTNSSSLTTSGYNKNNLIAQTFDIATTSAAINNTGAVEPQQPHSVRNTTLHYPPSSEKDVNVKCTKSNSNAIQRPDELGRMPTIEATFEQTTASKTPTEIPAPAEATISSSTTTVAHKHEPLQLLVKDRHLIGTPLLMHKGENLMVTADELALPTNNHKNVQETNNSSSSIYNKEHYDLETNTMANDNKYKPHLETGQSTTLSTTTEATPSGLFGGASKINISTRKSAPEDKKLADPAAGQDDLEKMKKTNYDTKTKKPSLIMKKMTIITKPHEGTQYVQPAESFENEVHAKQFDNSHYQELKPLANSLENEISQARKHKHSTVNTPINSYNPDNTQPANLLKQPHTFQHEHELLIQQILQDQQAETHAKLTKSEQWSDLRKTENKEHHSGVILLVSSGLFLVLLLGLMHVYRCDMPWRRHSPSHHMRPHQRQNHSFEDDSHSFLSYSEGMQKWHHSTRLEAPYNSPLHNLHVRELQKTSATEKPATVKSTVINLKPSLGHSTAFDNSRSLSQSSTTTTSTASASSSAFLDDETFYIEMTPDSGQFARALQSELLPMELLNKTQVQMLEYPDSITESQTSLEDDYVVHYQQQQGPHLPHLIASTSSSSASAALPCSTSSPLTTTACRSVQHQTQARKFGLW